MRTYLLVLGIFVGASGCSQDPAAKADQASRQPAAISTPLASKVLRGSAVASLPDRGELLAYTGDSAPIKRGATRWYPVGLSEEHALRAVATGNLRVTTPEGRPLQFQYQRHIEHKNGNWTWVGRMEGAESGREAVLTFGEKAVFGSIPYDDAEPLKLQMSGGRTWLVQTDPLLAAAGHGTSSAEPDFLIPGSPGSNPGGASKTAAGAPPIAYSQKSSHTTVDIAMGYTVGLAASLGGQSQAITRLTHLVDLTNQAYTASGVDGELRLVRTVMVDYPDATSNRSALFELTGVNCTSGSGINLPNESLSCTSVGQPAALDPLIMARATYGADVVALVRRFDNPGSGSCGIGWMLGGGQREITSADAVYAMSVISDSSPEGNCRDDTLAHEVGHNLGLQHDRESAQGTDDSDNDGNLLDPEEYGRFPYSFGHSTGAAAGNFYTIMAIRSPGQVGYLVFSNPNLTSCGGQACGVPDQADNARALNQTMAVVAGFRATVVPRGIVQQDFNGDGASDVIWRNTRDGRNVLWLSAEATNPQSVSQVVGQAWRVVGAGDFNGDGVSDMFWRNGQDGRNTIWLSGNSATSQAVASVVGQAWQVAGVGDFNGDGISDVLWRNGSDGRNTVWLSADAATPQAVTPVSGQGWTILGVGDFNGDGMSDVFWRNRFDGRNTIWLSADSSMSQAVAMVGAQSWQVVATGDFNGDGAWDLLWRNSSDGRNTVWLGANAATQQAVSTVQSVGWEVATAGDYDGDGVSDLLWRNRVDGRNSLWLSANSATPKQIATVSDQAWTIAR